MLTSKTSFNLNKRNGKKERQLLRQLASEIMPTEKRDSEQKYF